MSNVPPGRWRKGLICSHPSYVMFWNHSPQFLYFFPRLLRVPCLVQWQHVNACLPHCYNSLSSTLFTLLFVQSLITRIFFTPSAYIHFWLRQYPFLKDSWVLPKTPFPGALAAQSCTTHSNRDRMDSSEASSLMRQVFFHVTVIQPCYRWLSPCGVTSRRQSPASPVW